MIKHPDNSLSTGFVWYHNETIQVQDSYTDFSKTTMRIADAPKPLAFNIIDPRSREFVCEP